VGGAVIAVALPLCCLYQWDVEPRLKKRPPADAIVGTALVLVAMFMCAPFMTVVSNWFPSLPPPGGVGAMVKVSDDRRAVEVRGANGEVILAKSVPPGGTIEHLGEFDDPQDPKNKVHLFKIMVETPGSAAPLDYQIFVFDPLEPGVFRKQTPTTFAAHEKRKNHPDRDARYRVGKVITADVVKSNPGMELVVIHHQAAQPCIVCVYDANLKPITSFRHTGSFGSVVHLPGKNLLVFEGCENEWETRLANASTKRQQYVRAIYAIDADALAGHYGDINGPYRDDATASILKWRFYLTSKGGWPSLDTNGVYVTDKANKDSCFEMHLFDADGVPGDFGWLTCDDTGAVVSQMATTAQVTASNNPGLVKAIGLHDLSPTPPDGVKAQVP
jgi:hypothetical protein